MRPLEYFADIDVSRLPWSKAKFNEFVETVYSTGAFAYFDERKRIVTTTHPDPEHRESTVKFIKNFITLMNKLGNLRKVDISVTYRDSNQKLV